MSRKEIMTEFQSKLRMTEFSAATHCSLCARAYKQYNPQKTHNALN